MVKYDYEMLVKAISFATEKHDGQKRIDGKPYITHPLEVAYNVDGFEAKIVAVLHDTLEDTHTTMLELERLFGTEIMDDVNLLSKKTTLPYEEYIQKIKVCGSPSVTAVKIADLKHNLNTIDNIPDVDKRERLRKRYEKALTVLEGL